MPDPVAAVRVDALSLDGTLNPGSFCWYRSETHPFIGIGFLCPCGCARPHALATTPPNAYIWNGNAEKPTLHPRITLLCDDGTSVHWEGLLRDGQWINTRE